VALLEEMSIVLYYKKEGGIINRLLKATLESTVEHLITKEGIEVNVHAVLKARLIDEVYNNLLLICHSYFNWHGGEGMQGAILLRVALMPCEVSIFLSPSSPYVPSWQVGCPSPPTVELPETL
jgi:hypothetical protein